MAEPVAPGSFRIFPGFAVPFAEVELSDVRGLNSDLRTLFLERESVGDTYRNPDPTVMQVGLFESRFDLFHWDDPCVVQLRDQCNAAVFRMVSELNGYGPEQLRDLRMNVDAWFHITRSGGAFGFHNHPMASWSGVYCVDSGYDEAPKSGALVFMHPAATANMFVDLGVANVRAPWGIAPKSYLLKPGQLLLFPSWLLHQVLPFHGPRERITVAFNAWFRKG